MRSQVIAPEEVSSVIGQVSVLSPEESQALQRCESIVQKVCQMSIEAGAALAQIRDELLYRAEFDTFEDYCRIRWGFQRGRAYALIAAAKMANTLAKLPNVPQPDHERPLRPLLHLSESEAQLAWQCAVANAAGGPITTRIVAQAVKMMQLGPKKPVSAAKHLNKAEQRKIVSSVMDELLVLITRQAAYHQLLVKAELLHSRIQELFAPSKPKK